MKKFLNAILQEELTPIREKRHYYETHIDEVYDILEKGSIEARKVAQETLKQVREAVGIEYFQDTSLRQMYHEKYKEVK